MGAAHASALKAVRDLVISMGGRGWRMAQDQHVYQDPGILDCHLLLPVDPATLIERLERAIVQLELLKAKGYDGLYPVWYDAKMDGDTLRPDQEDFKAAQLIAGVPVVTGTSQDFVAWLRAQGFKL